MTCDLLSRKARALCNFYGFNAEILTQETMILEAYGGSTQRFHGVVFDIRRSSHRDNLANTGLAR